MVRVQRTSLWLAAFFACAGIAYIGAYLVIRKPEGYLLFDAAVAALFSALFLIAGVLFVCVESVRQTGATGQRIVLPRPALAAESSLSKQFQQRQKVLAERLKIDELYFCEHAQAPCASWSFCGSAPNVRHVPLLRKGQGAPAAQSSHSCSSAAEQGQPLPVVQRSGAIVSCLALAPVAETVKPLCKTRPTGQQVAAK